MKLRIVENYLGDYFVQIKRCFFSPWESVLAAKDLTYAIYLLKRERSFLEENKKLKANRKLAKKNKHIYSEEQFSNLDIQESNK